MYGRVVLRSHLKSWCHRFATIALINERRKMYRERKERRERRDMACVCEMRSGAALVDTRCIWPSKRLMRDRSTNITICSHR